jgi:hypothetical protein
MTGPEQVRRLLGAAAHLCHAEAELAKAGYPEWVLKLETILSTIDMEISYLETDRDLTRPY